MQTTIFDDQSIHIDQADAPDGYCAKPAGNGTENKCHHCDWRAQCCDQVTDLTAPGHRCVSFAIVTKDGRTIQRADGCNVVFKRRRSA